MTEQDHINVNFQWFVLALLILIARRMVRDISEKQDYLDCKLVDDAYSFVRENFASGSDF